MPGCLQARHSRMGAAPVARRRFILARLIGVRGGGGGGGTAAGMVEHCDESLPEWERWRSTFLVPGAQYQQARRPARH